MTPLFQQFLLLCAVLGLVVAQDDPDWECDFSSSSCSIDHDDTDNGTWKRNEKKDFYFADFDDDSISRDVVRCFLPYEFESSTGYMTFRYRTHSKGHLEIKVCENGEVALEGGETAWTNKSVNISCSPSEVRISFTAVKEHQDQDPNVRLDDIKVYEINLRTTAEPNQGTTNPNMKTEPATSIIATSIPHSPTNLHLNMSTPVDSTDTTTKLSGNEDGQTGRPDAIFILAVTCIVLVLAVIGLMFGCRRHRKSASQGHIEKTEVSGENTYDNQAVASTEQPCISDQATPGGITADSQDTNQEHEPNPSSSPLANNVTEHNDNEETSDYFVLERPDISDDVSYQQAGTANSGSHTYQPLIFVNETCPRSVSGEIHTRKITSTSRDETYQDLGPVNESNSGHQCEDDDTYNHLHHQATTPKDEDRSGPHPVNSVQHHENTDTYSHLENSGRRGETYQGLGCVQLSPPEDDDTYNNLTLKASTDVKDLGEDYSTTHAIYDQEQYNSLDHGHEKNPPATDPKDGHLFDDEKYASVTTVRSNDAPNVPHLHHISVETDGEYTGTPDNADEHEYGVLLDGSTADNASLIGMTVTVGGDAESGVDGHGDPQAMQSVV